MINDKGILIKNVYHMLSYAFQELEKSNYESISQEEFENIQNLFAEILYRGMSYQLKQGLYKEYILRKDTLPTLRGKLDINETIAARTRRQNVLACEFDELSENNILNQILKTTALILVREKSVDKRRKWQLKSLLPYFDGVNEINPLLIRWDTLRFQRSNQTYRMLMNICYFIIKGMLLTTESGSYKMATFSEKHMEKLFEKFVLMYYKRERHDVTANASGVKWDITNPEEADRDFLPSMKTDITLRKGLGTLVIDTKYYTHMMQEQFDKSSIHSSNMYQVFSYVKNLDTGNTGMVAGMLLYAKTQSEKIPSLDVKLGMNRFLVKTLDLNCEFKDICEQLNSFISFIPSSDS